MLPSEHLMMASLHTALAAQHRIVQILCSGCLWSEGLILLCLGVVAECYWTPLLWLCLHPSSSRKWGGFSNAFFPTLWFLAREHTVPNPFSLLVVPFAVSLFWPSATLMSHLWSHVGYFCAASHCKPCLKQCMNATISSTDVQILFFFLI